MESRRYIQHTADMIMSLASENWTNRQILRDLLSELSFRRSPAAERARLKISAKLNALTASTTRASPASGLVSALSTHQGNIPSLYQWQQEALHAWRANGRRGIVEAVTGAGKTVLGIAAIRDELNGGGRATVVVPTIELMRQWHERLNQQLPTARVALLGGGAKSGPGSCDVLVATVHSGSSYTISPQAGSSLLVADEVHRMAADKFSLALENNFNHRLGLSATWQRNDGRHEIVLQPYFDGVVFTLDYARARRENAISDFRMALVGVQLGKAERDEYEAACMKARKYKNRLIAQFGGPSEPFDAFMKWVNAAKNGQVPGAEKLAGFYLAAFQKQRALLAESSAKLTCAEGLAPAVRASNRTLGFTSTIEAAVAINSTWSSVGLLSRTYHSKLSDSERKYVMGEFRDGRMKALVAPKVLDEGIDVPDVDLGLIMGTSHSRIQLVQRIGRVLRRKPNGAQARICLLYVIDTPEDPDRGAHEAALADIRQAADEIETFVYPNDQKEVLAFLGP